MLGQANVKQSFRLLRAITTIIMIFHDYDLKASHLKVIEAPSLWESEII